MKLTHLFFALTLLACAKTPLADSPAATPPAETPSPVVNSGGIGTEGGGGTLVFAFRQGAYAALRAMEKNPSIQGKDPLYDGLNVFYRAHRERWMRSLEHFVFDAERVKESSEILTENGVPVGAKSLPAEAPTGVRLSVPYLSGKEGFTFAKAFALAVHEAGHFAKPDVSQLEHPYLDQIANLLFWMREGATPQKEIRLKFPNLYGDAAYVASDGRTLMAIGDGKGLVTIDIESGIRMTEAASFERATYPIHRNWTTQLNPFDGKTPVEQTISLRNLVTREQIAVTVPKGFVVAGILEDDRTLVLAQEVEERQRAQILLHDVRTGERRSVQTQPKQSGYRHFDEDYTREIQGNGRTAVVSDTATGNVIDFARASNDRYTSSQGGIFLPNDLVLLEWFHTGPDYEYELRRLGGESLALVRGTQYLGTLSDGKQFALTRPRHGYDSQGIVIYDIEAREEKFHPLPDLTKARRFEGQTGIVYDRDSSVWLTDLADLTKQTRISTEDARESTVGIFTSLEGRIVVTQDYDSHELVVRYLDRKG